MRESSKKILIIENTEITHLASTKSGSSRNPIFLEDCKKVLGIHKQCNIIKENNYGDLLGPVFDYLMTDTKKVENIYNITDDIINSILAFFLNIIYYYLNNIFVICYLLFILKNIEN